MPRQSPVSATGLLKTVVTSNETKIAGVFRRIIAEHVFRPTLLLDICQGMVEAMFTEIGSANVGTPVTNAQLLLTPSVPTRRAALFHLSVLTVRRTLSYYPAGLIH